MKRCIAVAVVLMSGSLADAAFITSTFDTDSEGWVYLDIPGGTNHIAGVYSVYYSSTGGNPGGHIWGEDFAPSSWSFGAPAVYLGDRSYAIGGVASFDLSVIGSGSIYDHQVFWLRGTSTLLLYNPPGSLTSSFTHIEVPLSPGPDWIAFQLDSNGYTTGLYFSPTPDDFLMTMSNLVSVEVRGDYINGNEVTRLDNFSFPAADTTIPAPAAMALTSIGMGLVGWLRRRKTI